MDHLCMNKQILSNYLCSLDRNKNFEHKANIDKILINILKL